MKSDITVTIGSTAAVVSGKRAGEAVDAIGAIRTAMWIGYEIPLADLPRLRAIAVARRWSLVEHDAARTT